MHLTVTRGTCYQPDHHYPDSPEDTHDTVFLPGPPQGKANNVSTSSIQRKSKRRWQSTDIRTTFIMHPLHNTSEQLACAIRIESSGSSIKVKRVLHAITTTSHGPRPIICRVKGRVEVTTSHFPRSFYMITSHDI